MAAISGTVAAIIGATAMASAGAGAWMASSGKKREKPPDINSPVAPTPESAEEKAKAEMLKKRRTQQLRGGKTILASQYGGNTDSTTKTLLGQ